MTWKKQTELCLNCNHHKNDDLLGVICTKVNENPQNDGNSCSLFDGNEEFIRKSVIELTLQNSEYPQKPIIEESKNKSNPIFSVILFLIASFFYFDNDVSFVIIITIILLIHELGHLVAMRYFNYSDVKIFFIPLLGAYTTAQKDEVSQRQNIIICLAGPIPGIIIAIGLYYYELYHPNNYVNQTAIYMFILNAFNLLPINPLDGGKIVASLFDNTKKTILLLFNILSIIALIAVALFLKTYLLLILPIAMILNYLKHNKIQKIKKQLTDSDIDFNKNYNDLTDKEYWHIRQEVIKNFKFEPKIDIEDKSFSSQEPKIVSYVKLITSETKQIFDITNRFRIISIAIVILGIYTSLFFIKTNAENQIYRITYEIVK